MIVASNGPGKEALKAYRRRWQIECLFGASKTRGLNMEDTRLTQPVKLNTLLVIITLAMARTYAWRARGYPPPSRTENHRNGVLPRLTHKPFELRAASPR